MQSVKYIGLCVAILATTACNTNQPSNPVVKVNNTLHADDVKPYKNLYVSPFQGLGPYHEIDTIDFVTPAERKPIKDSIFKLYYSGFDKTHGFNYRDNLFPLSIHRQSHNMITWLGHASFFNSGQPWK